MLGMPTPPENRDPAAVVLTMEQIRDRLGGVSSRTVTRYIKELGLPAWHLHDRRLVVIESDLAAWLAEQKAKALAEKAKE
jgi:hypothetical protein